jgi:hypothetical protein
MVICKTRKLAVAAVLISLTASVAAQQYDVYWRTVDSGGGNSSSIGARYVVDGTIGQPDAGVMSGGPFSVTGGFWAVGEVPSDVCAGFTAGLPGYSRFSDCLAGPGQAKLDGCTCPDADGDGDVDLSDFARFQMDFGD